MDHVFTRRRVAGLASTTALLLAVAVPASAHVFITDGGAVVGGGYGTEFTFRVPHGCDGTATTALEVQIPAGVIDVKPKLMAGWTIDVVSTPPVLPSMAPDASFTDEQIDAMDAPVVTSVKWSGGTLPDSQYADFQLMAVFPETPATVALPTVQDCGDTQVAWIEIPAAGQTEDDLEHPAPTVTVVAPATSPAP